jgi:hypothetical protein
MTTDIIEASCQQRALRSGFRRNDRWSRPEGLHEILGMRVQIYAIVSLVTGGERSTHKCDVLHQPRFLFGTSHNGRPVTTRHLRGSVRMSETEPVHIPGVAQ